MLIWGIFFRRETTIMSSTKEKSKSCMMYDRIYWERTAKAKKTKQWFIKRCSTMLRWKAYSIIITFHFYEWCTIWGGISTQNSTFQFLHSLYETLCEKICRHISSLGKKEVWCIYQSKQVSPLYNFMWLQERGWLNSYKSGHTDLQPAWGCGEGCRDCYRWWWPWKVFGLL